MKRKENFCPVRQCSVEFYGFCNGEKYVEGFMDALRSYVDLVRNDRPLARLGPVRTRNVRYAHPRKDET